MVHFLIDILKISRGVLIGLTACDWLSDLRQIVERKKSILTAPDHDFASRRPRKAN